MIPTALASFTRAELLRSGEAELCRRSLARFIRVGWHVLHPGDPLEWSMHHDAICDHVQVLGLDLIAARRDRTRTMAVQNFLINIPPRQLKTEILQIFFPAWLWLHDPSVSIRCISGNARVVNKASRDCRALVGSTWYRDTFTLSWDIHDVDAVKEFTNTARGRRLASTVLENITGEGTDVLIVDDPHDADDALSAAMRQRTLDAWDLAISSRVNDERRCLRLGIMQRLDVEDWSAHVLQQGWRHLCLPMEFVPVGARGRCNCADCTAGMTFASWCDPRTADGDLLDAVRWPKDKLEEKRLVLGEYGYAGQMQQVPAPIDGGLFKRAWFGNFNLSDVPKFERVIISADTAISKKTTADYSAIIVMGTAGQYKYVLHVVRARLDFPELKRQMFDLVKQWRPSAVLIEGAGPSGKAAYGDLKAAGMHNLIEVVPEADKVARALSVTPTCQAGDVMLVKAAPWADTFLHELCSFPVGKDDQVDAFTQALRYLRDQQMPWLNPKAWAL